jgi:hypothetical protein
LTFGVRKDLFQIDFGKMDDEIKLKRTLTVKAIDQGSISRDSYREITSLSNDLIKEWAVSKENQSSIKRCKIKYRFLLLN